MVASKGAHANPAVSFEFSFEKAAAAFVYLAADPRVTALDKYKAGKLLYLADKYHVVKYGRPILGDEYRALNYGPVPQMTLDCLHKIEVENAAKQGGNRTRQLLAILDVDHSWPNPRFRAKSVPNTDVLSKSEVRALDRIIELHGRKSFDELKNLTHDRAYRKAWEAKPEGKKMAPMRYEDFFLDDPDVVEGSLEEMLANATLRRALSER